MKMDEMKVLNTLEQHSKEHLDKIAQLCGFSHQKVSRIIKNLEKNKIIWGYPPVTENNGEYLKHFTLLVKRSNVPFDDDIRKEVSFDKIDNKISDLAKIENIYATHGEICDFIFTFYSKDIITAKKFVGLLFERHSNHIKNYYILETLVHMRKQGLKNPNMKELAKYL